MKFKLILVSLCIILSVLLLTVNIVGLFKEIRPQNLSVDNLRFDHDLPIDYQQAITQLHYTPSLTPSEYANQVTKVVAASLAHIHWNEELDPTKYNQLVPIWENYILYLMGKFSGIPEYQKYHYIDYERSLERGIGICGDASMISSQLLNKANIDNKIISFKSHVVVTTRLENGDEITLDPDYGVVIPLSLAQIIESPELVSQYYRQTGYSEAEALGVQSVYRGQYQKWNGVKHFVTKKYYFEYLAYILKWLLPMAGLLFALVLIRKNSSKFNY